MKDSNRICIASTNTVGIATSWYDVTPTWVAHYQDTGRPCNSNGSTSYYNPITYNTPSISQTIDSIPNLTPQTYTPISTFSDSITPLSSSFIEPSHAPHFVPPPIVSKSGRDHYESKTQERFADFSGNLGLNNRGQCNVSKLLETISLDNVTSLSLVGTKMGLNSAKYISPLLSDKNFHFSSLNLTKNQLGDEGLAYMIQGLSVHPEYFHSVTHLYLAQNRLTDTAAHYFDSWLRSGHLPYLRTLNISGNKLTHAGKSLLTKTVESVDHQIYITLDTGVVVTKTHLSFADSYRNDIYKAYKRDEIIDFSGSLGLRANKQSDAAKLLEKVTSFRSFEDIRCLSFVESNMGKNTARDFDSLLSKENFNFDGVYLSKNQIGDLGLPHIIHALSVSPTCFHNVVKLDLSSNRLTDISAKAISDALVSGSLPGLKITHVGANKFSPAAKSLLVKALDSISQDIKIVFDEVKGFSKEALKGTIKKMLFIAKANGITTKETLTNNETVEHCKKGVPNVALNVAWGVTKCLVTPAKYLTPQDLTLQDVAVDITTVALETTPYARGALTFYCISVGTIFSVVDEDFANCLTGVDSMLDD